MKFVKKIKKTKPEQWEGQLKPWHGKNEVKGHVHEPNILFVPGNLNEESLAKVKEFLAPLKSEKPALVAGDPPLDALTKVDYMLSGPVYHAGDLAPVDEKFFTWAEAKPTVHPENISVSLALDALKYHGIVFKNISMAYAPLQDIEINATMWAGSGKGQKAVMEMHSWLYTPGKGY